MKNKLYTFLLRKMDLEIHGHMGVIVTDASGKRYMYLPFWIEVDNDQYLDATDGQMIEVKFHDFQKLPKDLKNYIKETRYNNEPS